MDINPLFTNVAKLLHVLLPTLTNTSVNVLINDATARRKWMTN